MTVHGLFTDLPKFKDVRTSLARHATKRFPVLNMNGKTEIAIHHALVRQGLAGANAEGYARFHVHTHNWPGIGYPYVIEPDGTIKFCNPINWRTYHVGNSNNFSIGICLTGDFRTDKVTPEQAESLRLLVNRLKREYPQINRIRSHHEYPGYATKQCCVFNYEQVLNQKVTTPKPKPVGNKHTVQEGDTFWSIAKGQDFEVVDLEHANPGVNPLELRIGQVINIPTDSKEKATPEEKKSPAYHGNSIVKYLQSIGEDSSYSNRARMASKYGINSYRGTASQNIQLLNILRDGEKAPSTEVVKTPTKQLKKGDSVTVPAGRLFAQGNAVNPVNNARLTARVDHINQNWRNSVRLINSNGQYVGFARLSDLTGAAVPVAPKVTFKTGDRVTASRLYVNGGATSPARTTPVAGYIERYNENWRNPYRLTSTRGGKDYIGFARRNDLSK